MRWPPGRFGAFTSEHHARRGLETGKCVPSSETFGDTETKNSNSNTGGVLDKLVECTTRGAQVELTLRNGKKISRFRVHEVIAPKGLQMMPNRREARARGIVWPERGTRRDEYVQVRDIESVRDERSAAYCASEEFFERHPLPPNWGRLARCPAEPKR